MNADLAAHLSPDALADYFGRGLSDDREIEVEEHLATCDTCISAARGAFMASGAIDRWTARAHGEAALAGVLAGALGALREQAAFAAWRERLAAWADRWAGQAEAALRVVLAAPGQAVRALAEEMPDLARPGTAWQLAPAPAARPTRGASRGRRAAQPIVVTAGGPGAPSVQVVVSGDRGEVAVRLDDVPPGAEPPLVLLVPTDRAGEPRLAAPMPSRGTGRASWIARFEGLGPGEYLVAFEPLG